MAVILKIRCRKCGKVYRFNAENSGKRVKCPKCKNTLTIPKALSIEKRKETRAVIPEASQSIQLSEALTSSKDISSYRVVYTEADPIEFALKRNLSVPLLDLSEDGLGFYIKADQASQKLSKGSLIPIEIGFPILVQPAKIKVQVKCGGRYMKNELARLAVNFTSQSHPFMTFSKV